MCIYIYICICICINNNENDNDNNNNMNICRLRPGDPRGARQGRDKDLF